MESISPSTMKKIQLWLEGPYDAETKAEIRELLVKDPKALSDAFFKDLSFGTGGMRGIMGVGTNRMNIYTIRKATKGLSSYIHQHGKGKLSVFIGYDVRHHSAKFAEETARVLAGNGIHVFISRDICPTPLVSFGCRHFQCTAAIMITASHNPPQYNGYKVYWSDGAQVVEPHDTGIMQEVHLADQETVLSPLTSPLIEWVGPELFEAYLQTIRPLQLYPELASDKVKIVYSPLHGTGVNLLPAALRDWGYSNIEMVKEQSFPDGAFPNALKPNPEERSTLALGAQLLEKTKGDVFIATDPDADRIGAVERGPHFFTGNQMACLLLHHLCQKGKKGACIKSIVTTELFRKIGEDYGLVCFDVLTGFKYIGEQMTLWEKSQKYSYVFGAEESCGYLASTDLRDKDAISTACLIAEMAALAKKDHTTLQGRLYKLYQTYGIYRDALLNFTLSDTPEGMEKMGAIMRNLRLNPPQTLGNEKIVQTEDFLENIQNLPSSDVLRFWLADETKVVIRPSGTEPKLKVYLEGKIAYKTNEEMETQIAACDAKLEKLSQVFKALFPLL